MRVEVNIYTYTTVKGPGRKNGAFTYILEADTVKGTATLNKSEALIGVTEHQAELVALLKALKRLNQPCQLNIYTESEYVAAGYEQGRVEHWQKNDWKNAKGKQVANKEEWQEIAEILGVHSFRFVVGAEHSYRNWIIKETEKEKIKCTNNLENLTALKN